MKNLKTFEYNLYEADEYNDETGKSLGQTNYTIKAEDEEDASCKLRREHILPSMRSRLREINRY